ncbi:helix-turn-helix domain-containing protein, partial [Facklamia sp. P12945]|uniref:helix-turn-helix domain-containing protein n=1 Tax=unclassified Facklamia TaxID=2622293 RepID=UPI003D17883F
MAQTYGTTSPKGKHLSYEERVKIEAYKTQVPPPSNRAIARLLGRSPQTIHTKVKRGTVTQKRKQ